MAKLIPFVHKKGGEIQGYHFWCPGCGAYHGFHVKGTVTWKFNGDMEKPTFTPSLLIDKSRPERRCHLFLTDGQLRFLGDCWHDLKGTTVPLPDDPC